MLLHRPQAEVRIRYPAPPEELIVHTAADALGRWHLRQLVGFRAVRVGQRDRWGDGGG